MIGLDWTVPDFSTLRRRQKSRVFPHVFVDEIQALAGYDLDILAALARSSVRLIMVGDPRQATYLTHHERRHKKYADGGIIDFLRNEFPRSVSVDIDETTLNRSHRDCSHLRGVVTTVSGSARQPGL